MTTKGCYKILLIGQSGAGKTSFLNLIYNLEIIRSLHGKFGLDVFRCCHDTELERVPLDPMESQTIGAKEYRLQFNGIDVHITDTPGFGDTQGAKKDEEHLRTIQKAAQNVDCCCLIINGRQPRSTLHLQNTFKQISDIFSGELKTCSIVILTNVQKLIEASIDVRLLLHYTASQSQKDVYCIDNPYCLIEKMNQLPEPFKNQELIDSLKRNLNISDNTIKRIVERIQTLHRVVPVVSQQGADMEQAKLKPSLNKSHLITMASVIPEIQPAGLPGHAHSYGRFLNSQDNELSLNNAASNQNMCQSPILLIDYRTEHKLVVTDGKNITKGESSRGQAVKENTNHSSCAQLCMGDITTKMNGKSCSQSDIKSELRCPERNQVLIEVIRPIAKATVGAIAPAGEDTANLDHQLQEKDKTKIKRTRIMSTIFNFMGKAPFGRKRKKIHPQELELECVKPQHILNQKPLAQQSIAVAMESDDGTHTPCFDKMGMSQAMSDRKAEPTIACQQAVMSISIIKGQDGFSLEESPRGLVVKEIKDHSCCAQLCVGDIIIKVNGKPVHNYSQRDIKSLLRCSNGNQAMVEETVTGGATNLHSHRQKRNETTSIKKKDSINAVHLNESIEEADIKGGRRSTKPSQEESPRGPGAKQSTKLQCAAMHVEDIGEALHNCSHGNTESELHVRRSPMGSEVKFEAVRPKFKVTVGETVPAGEDTANQDRLLLNGNETTKEKDIIDTVVNYMGEGSAQGISRKKLHPLGKKVSMGSKDTKESRHKR